jgi:ferredoxin
VAVAEGSTLLEIAESNDLPIEAGCRMGMCGADPIGVLDGMASLSPIGDEERKTLERLGLAPGNTRMACCARVLGSVRVTLEPARPARPISAAVLDFTVSRSIKRMVVIGNGIAGVTCADHVRRRHPTVEIDVVADEPHHLYNRMAITRLIYHRSALQGLFLLPDAWWEANGVTPSLNTRVSRLDLAAHEVVLGTGERLGWDRLVLAMGSSSHVPALPGYGARMAALRGRSCWATRTRHPRSWRQSSAAPTSPTACRRFERATGQSSPGRDMPSRRPRRRFTPAPFHTPATTRRRRCPPWCASA